MNKRFVLLVMMIFLILVSESASANELLQISAETDDNSNMATFYTAAAGDKLYLCEAYMHSIYSVSMDGTMDKTDSIKTLEDHGDKNSYISPLALTSDGEHVYAISMVVNQDTNGVIFEGAALYELKENGALGTLVCELDLSDVIISEYDSQDMLNCLSTIVRDGYLHMLFDNGEGAADESESGQFLISFELARGEKRIRKTTGAMQLIDANDTEVLYAQAALEPEDTILQVVDMSSGETRKVNKLHGKSDRPRNIVYDQARESAFYSVMNQIWGIHKIGEDARMIGLLPTRILSGLYYASENKLYAYDSKNAFIFSVDWSADIDTQTLVVAGGNPQLDDYARLHPELEIQYSSSESNEMIDAVLTQSEVPDIFILSNDDSIFTALKTRGYLAPLDDPDMQQYVENLHPDIQKYLYSNDTLCAIPFSIEFHPMLGVNHDIWESLNIGDVPQSWPELLDFVESWCNSSKAGSGIQLIDLTDGESTRGGFIRRLTDDYEAYRAKQENMGYDTEIFRNLMEHIESISWENLDYPTGTEQESTLFQYSYFPTLQLDHAQYLPMPLSIEENGQPIVTANLSIAAVNPYSQRMDIAADYLKYVVENIDSVTKIEMCPNLNDPLEKENYAETIENLTTKIEDLNQQISVETNAAERKALEWEKQIAEEELQGEKEDPWSVSPEDISQFRRLSQRISVLNEAGLNEDTRTVLKTCRSRLNDGEMSVDEFIAEIDRRIVMQTKEGT